MNAVRDLLPGHLMPVLGNVDDLLLWCYLKSKVLATKPNTISELKNSLEELIRLKNKVAAIPMSMIRRVMTNVVKRWRPVWRTEEDI